MKLKTAGLTAITAIVLAASHSPGAASATTLCKVSTNPCPAGSAYVAGNHLTGTLQSGTNAVLTGSPEIICTQSQMTIKLTSAFGSGEITSLTFAGCKTGGIGCTVTVVGLPYPIQFDVVGSGPNGTETVTGGSFLAICSGFINCTFGSKAISLPTAGGSVATLTASAVEMKPTSGFLCPSSIRWDAVYTTPNLWIRA